MALVLTPTEKRELRDAQAAIARIRHRADEVLDGVVHDYCMSIQRDLARILCARGDQR